MQKLTMLYVADWREKVACTVYDADVQVYATATDSIERYLNRAYRATKDDAGRRDICVNEHPTLSVCKIS